MIAWPRNTVAVSIASSTKKRNRKEDSGRVPERVWPLTHADVLFTCFVVAVELVHQDPSASIARGRSTPEGQPRCNVAELLPLRLHYKVPWPLSMIVDDTMLVKYNQVLIFLLQVTHSSFSAHNRLNYLLAVLLLAHVGKSDSRWAAPDVCLIQLLA